MQFGTHIETMKIKYTNLSLRVNKGTLFCPAERLKTGEKLNDLMECLLRGFFYSGITTVKFHSRDQLLAGSFMFLLGSSSEMVGQRFMLGYMCII